MSAELLGLQHDRPQRFVFGRSVRQDLKLLEIDEALLESLQEERLLAVLRNFFQNVFDNLLPSNDSNKHSIDCSG